MGADLALEFLDPCRCVSISSHNPYHSPKGCLSLTLISVYQTQMQYRIYKMWLYFLVLTLFVMALILQQDLPAARYFFVPKCSSIKLTLKEISLFLSCMNMQGWGSLRLLQSVSLQSSCLWKEGIYKFWQGAHPGNATCP